MWASDESSSTGFGNQDDHFYASSDVEFDDTEQSIEAFRFECLALEDVDGLLAIEAPARITACLCKACLEDLPSEQFRSLACGHRFCANCWISFLEAQIGEGRSIEIFCMEEACEIVVPMEFVVQLLGSQHEHLKSRYVMLYRNERIRESSQLLFCPGVDCRAVIHVDKVEAKRVVCSFCETQFCCRCKEAYHAPASCEAMKDWLKARTENGNALYILRRTKNCPKCDVPIEKNGGCDHMRCSRCRHDFCWLCGGFHDGYGHSCVESPNPGSETSGARQRQRLKKYLSYSKKWDAHAQSLRLEGDTKNRILHFIEGRVADGEGTFLSWKYLLDAADVVRKCRYTLQYSYPHAYSLEAGPLQEIFEFQQSELESAIEDLSGKLEQAEWTTRDEIAQQKNLVEKHRTTLLKDWLKS